VIFASGLKYIGIGTTTLGWIMCAVLLTAAIWWLAWTQPWANGKAPARQAAPAPSAAERPPEGVIAERSQGPTVPTSAPDRANGQVARRR
jgi:hypothetical protein